MKTFSQFVLIFFVILLTLIGIAQFSGTNGIKLPGFSDRRLFGVDTSGWTDKQFEFQDSSLLGLGVKVGFGFESKRPNGPAEVEFEVNGEKIPAQKITGKPIYFSLNKFTEGISIKATVLNPFHSPESDEEKGVKLVRVSIDSNPLIIPSLKLIMPIAGLMTLIIFIIYLSLSNLTLSFALCYLPLFILFIKNQTAQWEIALWLLVPMLVVCIGHYFSKKIFSNEVSSSSSSNKFYYGFVLILFLIGLWLRISTVSFGLPELYHPDESRKLNIMRSMIIRGNLDPDYFRHPSFMLYSGAFTGKVWSILHNGEIPSIPTLGPLARSVSAVFGSATILLLFLIGRFLYGNIAGLVAAATITFSPLHVVCSRYVKEDICMIFFMLLTFYLILQFIFKSPSRNTFYLAALSAGVATSIKYTGILSASFLLAPFLVWFVANLKNTPSLISQLIQDSKEAPVSKLSLSTLFSFFSYSIIIIGIAFLMITPYAIFNSERFIKDFLFEGRHMSSGHSGVISAVNYFWSYHLKVSITGAFGFILTLLSLFCLGAFCFRGDLKGLIPLLGVLLFYLPAEWVNAKPFPQAERYILPALPFLGLVIGGFLSTLNKQSKSRMNSLLVKGFGAITFLGILQIAQYSFIHQSLMMTDTRRMAKRWVDENIPENTKIVTDWFFYGPNLNRERYNIVELKTPEQAEILKSMSVKTLKDTGAQYFITSSFFYDRYLFFAKKGNLTGRGYEEIFQNFEIVKEFKPSSEEGTYGFHNPTIRILKLQ